MRVYHSSVSALHITNGDCAANTLRSFLTDPVLITCDVLHDGPAPAVDGDAWHEVRARWLTEGYDARFAETRASLAAFDRTVTQPGRHDEIVLWFEHDLFDQLLLIRTLDLLARAPVQYVASDVLSAEASAKAVSRASVSLICIGEFPGIERFIGLGQLDAEQLASLYPERKPVTTDQYALASEAWRAFRAKDPAELHALMVRLTPPFDVAQGGREPVEGPGATYANDTLPFLPGAIHRLLEEYPSTTNGLSRSADAILRALASGPLDAGVLFSRTQAEESRPFMGDLGHFDIVRALASARVPLVGLAPPSLNDSDGAAAPAPDLRGHTVSITDAGRRVLAGRDDAVTLNGIDEWRGGVHLVGADRSPWRWHRDRETLVS
jgi:hypothetical protein